MIRGSGHLSAKVKAKYSFLFNNKKNTRNRHSRKGILENHMKNNKMLHGLGQIIDCRKRESDTEQFHLRSTGLETDACILSLWS